MHIVQLQVYCLKVDCQSIVFMIFFLPLRAWMVLSLPTGRLPAAKPSPSAAPQSGPEGVDVVWRFTTLKKGPKWWRSQKGTGAQLRVPEVRNFCNHQNISLRTCRHLARHLQGMIHFALDDLFGQLNKKAQTISKRGIRHNTVMHRPVKRASNLWCACHFSQFAIKHDWLKIKIPIITNLDQSTHWISLVDSKRAQVILWALHGTSNILRKRGNEITIFLTEW